MSNPYPNVQRRTKAAQDNVDPTLRIANTLDEIASVLERIERAMANQRS